MPGRVGERLAQRGHELLLAGTAAECSRLLQSDGADLVVMCLPIPRAHGADLLDAVVRLDRAMHVVVCGTDATIRDSGDAFGRGAFEYVGDALAEPNELLAAVGVALGSRRGDVQLRYMRRKEAARASWDRVVGNSTPMQEVLRLAQLLCARTSMGAAPTVLITGETGTGKGLLAQCIHYNGGRRTRPFVDVNCAAIPPQLLESELFGHERGAFTNAFAARPGLFETADRGTLFLDEIGTMPMPLQVKVLNAIEEKRVRRVGARQSVEIDVQVIAATHVDLRDAARRGAFREDLFHRLNVVAIRIPPLRQRGEDKIALAEEFIAQRCAEYGLPLRQLTPAARSYLMEYAWPGNVRELKNVIERVLVLNTDEVIDVEHLDARPSSPPPSRRSFHLSLPPEGVPLDEIERQAIRAALARAAGNVSRAARLLEISRQTLVYRMRKHGILAEAPRE